MGWGSVDDWSDIITCNGWVAVAVGANQSGCVEVGFGAGFRAGIALAGTNRITHSHWS